MNKQNIKLENEHQNALDYPIKLVVTKICDFHNTIS